MKIYTKPESESQGKLIQQKWIEKGYLWASGLDKPQYLDATYLLLDDVHTDKVAISFRNRLPKNMGLSDMKDHVYVIPDFILSEEKCQDCTHWSCSIHTHQVRGYCKKRNSYRFWNSLCGDFHHRAMVKGWRDR